MFAIRPVTMEDFDQLKAISFEAHKGMMSLPKNPKLLAHKILHSVSSMEKSPSQPFGENYFFVLEELKTKKLVGTCGIYSVAGHPDPQYFFRIQSHWRESPSLQKRWEEPLLHIISHHPGNTEICAIYLLKPFRKGGLGRLLSLSRFLFIACFPQRFRPRVSALMRGVFNEHDQCPFWEGCGKRLLGMEFEEVLVALEQGRDFIPDFLPRHPVYVQLLSDEAQASLGQAHRNTQPALAMLKDEGFGWDREIDVFDGGPHLTCARDNIRAVKDSLSLPIHRIQEYVEGDENFVICNERIDFRCCLGKVQTSESGEVAISKEVAKALMVEKGDSIRYVGVRSSVTPQHVGSTHETGKGTSD